MSESMPPSEPLARLAAPVPPALTQADPEPESARLTSAILMREKAEPKDGYEPVPFLVYVVFGALLLWGGFYFAATSGPMTESVTVAGIELPWFSSQTFDRDGLTPQGAVAKSAEEPNPQSLEDYKSVGATVYAAVCQACHQPNGQGNPSQGIPPLAGSEWVVGGEASPARLARIVLYGLSGPITVAGRTYNGQMPAQGGSLKDYQIAGVLTYVRNSFGNKGDEKEPAITTAIVRAARAKEPGRSTTGTAPMTEAALKAIPLNYTDGESASGAAPPPEKK